MDNLLFIDDDESFLKTNRVCFKSRGYTVYTAANAAEARKILEKQPVDCIILDVLLPETDG